MIPAILYLFCSRLARGIKLLKNNQYLDLFYLCLTTHSGGVFQSAMRDSIVRPARIAALIAGRRGET
ncbi:hypothetical protein RFM23_16425 [Mesorhizobium abyssinicae]|uniref:Uncharacterized protein n=1 Tax=Mesorhizobium abyssinicae TaxID=1209958 RepID=A0ABU5APK7_9HYPH|nr:hypothetical protein [Mesorhizobium abyssinicae]MDX8539205.1 hypothetical protein [Mesorhizobium abyssinicae]